MRKTHQNQYISWAIILFTLFFQATFCFAEFTIDDEKKLGKEFYDKLSTHNFLLEDQKLNNYVTKIGNIVLAQSHKAPFVYRFSIINSMAINAFATPGGYIYVNKGLINSVENEAELAGVIAHEIAHANSRHIASIIEKSQKLNIAMIAAIIAGAFLGGGAEGTAAIAAFSVAGATSMTLKYQREHEEEADRLGISYLVNAGYDPPAMVDFLKLIKKHEFYSRSMPSYLRTHPGTDDRIFYLDSLIRLRYPQHGAKNIVGNFNRMQALIALDTDNLRLRKSQLEDSLKKDPSNVDLLYALALIEDQLGETDHALQHFKTALKMAPQDEDVLMNIGLLYLKMDQADQALIYLLKVENLNPASDDIIPALGKTYFALGNYLKSLEYYLQVKDKTIQNIDVNYYIAMAYGKLNNQGESHFYFGLHFKKAKKKESALFHFKEALKYFPQTSARADAINKAVKELTSDSPRISNNKPKRSIDLP